MNGFWLLTFSMTTNYMSWISCPFSLKCFPTGLEVCCRRGLAYDFCSPHRTLDFLVVKPTYWHSVPQADPGFPGYSINTVVGVAVHWWLYSPWLFTVQRGVCFCVAVNGQHWHLVCMHLLNPCFCLRGFPLDGGGTLANMGLKLKRYSNFIWRSTYKEFVILIHFAW